MKRHAFVPDVTGFPGCAEHVVHGQRIGTCDRPFVDPVHVMFDRTQPPAGGMYALQRAELVAAAPIGEKHEEAPQDPSRAPRGRLRRPRRRAAARGRG